MNFVLDASVVVAAVRPPEPLHERSRLRLLRILQGPDTISVPAIFPAEIASVLTRAGERVDSVRALLAALRRPPHEVVSISPSEAILVAETAMRFKLRAADAMYVWLAMERGLPLITLDKEIQQRARECQVRAP